MYDLATYFAWFVLALLLLVVVAAIVALGSLPKKIALRRNHPQVDAINAASWIGLAMFGAGWPIAFVWAFLRSGAAGSSDVESNSPVPDDTFQRQEARINELQKQVDELRRQLQSVASKTG